MCIFTTYLILVNVQAVTGGKNQVLLIVLVTRLIRRTLLKWVLHPPLNIEAQVKLGTYSKYSKIQS